ncbi:MAG: amidohydrolase family protein [Acidobacteria bacterium]|nr:amidohydrolase family protein [Acidobacteriota bacterium]
MAGPYISLATGRNVARPTRSQTSALDKYVPAYWRDVTWHRFADEMLPDLVRDPLVLRQEYFARNLQMVGAFHDAGVPFMAGTDTAAGVYILPGFSLHDELANFVEAVFTPMEALETATSNPAVFLGMKASIGSIEAGKFADLLLLGANPLKNIRNTEKIKVVIAHGQVLDRAALDEILRKVESAASVRRSTTNFQSSENTEQGYR